VRGGRVRRPLADRLDLVRAGQRVRGADLRRLAGRPRAAGAATGPSSSAAAGSLRRDPQRLALAAAAIVAALLAAWSQWQPQRSEDARAASLAALATDPRAALADAHAAVSRDPLSIEALFVLAEVQTHEGQTATARQTLQKAVRMQPSNPATWLALGRFDLSHDPASALRELQASIFLDPQSISAEALAHGDPHAIEVHNYYIQALRAAGVAGVTGGAGVAGAAVGVFGAQTRTAALRTASALPVRAAGAARPAARPRR
jgi:tetratricopeptide (TPR) repeat protein